MGAVEMSRKNSNLYDFPKFSESQDNIKTVYIIEFATSPSNHIENLVQKLQIISISTSKELR